MAVTTYPSFSVSYNRIYYTHTFKKLLKEKPRLNCPGFIYDSRRVLPASYHAALQQHQNWVALRTDADSSFPKKLRLTPLRKCSRPAKKLAQAFVSFRLLTGSLLHYGTRHALKQHGTLYLHYTLPLNFLQGYYSIFKVLLFWSCSVACLLIIIYYHTFYFCTRFSCFTSEAPHFFFKL